MVSHFLFATGPSIGHQSQLIGLAAKLVQDRTDIIITFPVVGDNGELAKKQFEKYFTAENEHLIEHVRFINLGGEGHSQLPLILHLSRQFEAFYSSLYAEEDIRCARGRVYSAIPKPQMVLLDYFYFFLLLIIRKISQQMPILAWVPSSSAFVMYHYGPQKYGGQGNLSEKAIALSEKNGRPVKEIEAELIAQTNVVRLPGFPTVYDYEIAQRDPGLAKVMQDPEIARLAPSYRIFLECDGVVSASDDLYEPQLNAAIRQWFGERNKSCYFIGPLLPPDISGQSDVPLRRDLELSSNGTEVQSFLDKILLSYGERSMLYIAFGSFFWPNGDFIWRIFEVIVELKIPFVLAYNRNEELPSHIKELFDSYDAGLVSKWAPQQLILSHKASGWFLTHCGRNSIVEAISQGMPMIAWPVAADQHFNAINITLNHDIAYQLLEVRGGSNPKPLFRGVQPKGTIEAVIDEFKGVWAKAQSEDGARKRMNIQQLREKYKDLWEENGSCLKEYREFMNNYLKN